MASLTDKAGRAKCLAYRGGHRCGRVARIVGGYYDQAGYHRQSLCEACARRLHANVLQSDEKGFRVVEAGFGIIRREYLGISGKEIC